MARFYGGDLSRTSKASSCVVHAPNASGIPGGVWLILGSVYDLRMSTKRTSQVAILSLLVAVTTMAGTAHAATSTPSIAELQATLASLQAKLAELQSKAGGISITYHVTKKAEFDQRSYTSVATYPTVSGTANVPSVFVVVYNDKNEGIVGTRVPVENGTWSFQSSVALPIGYYRVDLMGGEIVQTRVLHVQAR